MIWNLHKKSGIAGRCPQSFESNVVELPACSLHIESQEEHFNGESDYPQIKVHPQCCNRDVII